MRTDKPQRTCLLYDELFKIYGHKPLDNLDPPVEIGIKRIKTNNGVSVPQPPKGVTPPPRQYPLETIDYQVLDTGQDQKFEKFMEMVERHHQEKMLVLNRLVDVLQNKS